MVRSVADFFEIEEEEWSIDRQGVENVVHQTAAACCVSESTVKRRRGAKPLKETRLKKVVKPQLGRPRITADEFTCSALRTIVHSFYHTKEHPNVDIRRSGGEADY